MLLLALLTIQTTTALSSLKRRTLWCQWFHSQYSRHSTFFGDIFCK